MTQDEQYKKNKKKIDKITGYTRIPDYLGLVLHLDAVSQIILARTSSFGFYAGDYLTLKELTGVKSVNTIVSKIKELENNGYIIKKTFNVEGTKSRTVIISCYDVNWNKRTESEIVELTRNAIKTIRDYYNKKLIRKARKAKTGDISNSSSNIIGIPEFDF